MIELRQNLGNNVVSRPIGKLLSWSCKVYIGPTRLMVHQIRIHEHGLLSTSLLWYRYNRCCTGGHYFVTTCSVSLRVDQHEHVNFSCRPTISRTRQLCPKQDMWQYLHHISRIESSDVCRRLQQTPAELRQLNDVGLTPQIFLDNHAIAHRFADMDTAWHSLYRSVLTSTTRCIATPSGYVLIPVDLYGC